MNRIFLFLLVSIFTVACNSDKKNSEYLPRASGKPGDMIIIMDSVLWKDTLGREVRRVFEAPVAGLAQDEPMFKVVFVQPNKSLRLITQVRNLVYVFTLDQESRGSKLLREGFSPETLERIQQDTSFYLVTQRNEYAKGQEVMYLFSDTKANLISHLQRDKQKIIDYFNKMERQRLEASLFATKSTQGVADFLRKEQQVELRVPFGYRLADKQKDFVWLRQMDAQIDKDIFITWKPYESEYQMLPDSIIDWRNEVCKKYLFEDPEKIDSYLVTEQKAFPVTAKQVNMNGHFSMELRGLWRTNNRSMGGPFVSYTLIDQPRGLLYYIEGFVYAPGKDKREMIRELETILWTFKTSAQVKQ